MCDRYPAGSSPDTAPPYALEQGRMNCLATTKTGAPCRAIPRPGRPYCFGHDPELDERRREARRRGGLTRAAALKEANPLAERPSLRTPEEVLGVLEGALGLLAAGKVGEARARTVGYLAQVALRALDCRFEDRLAALEQAAGIGGYHASTTSETETH